MSQQTPVTRVIPLWEAWMKRWPTPSALAEANNHDVLVMWANLGYPRRALRLRDCAQAIVDRHNGAVPSNIQHLEALPGIGTYTARAVMAFAHKHPVPVVDTNVRRVFKRLVLGEYLQGTARNRDLADIAQLLPYRKSDPQLSSTDHGLSHWWEGTEEEALEVALFMCSGLMELGAMICTARSPQCEICPVRKQCVWWNSGCPEPTEEAKAAAAQRVQKFEGTDRQVRGKIMALLRDQGAASRSAIDCVWPDGVQLQRALHSLLDDGLLHRVDTTSSDLEDEIYAI